MTTGIAEILPGFLLDILAFGVTPSGDIAIPTADATAYYSNSFPLRRGITYGWEVAFTSGGTVAAKIELEQGNQRPATEGASDTAWAVPDNKTASPMFSAVADTARHFTAYSPDATGFGRLKITGASGNAATTKLHVARAYAIKTV